MDAFKEQLFSQHMVRDSRQQKIDFFYFAAKSFSQNGYAPIVQRKRFLGIENQNLILGDPTHAKYILAAPYDTPKRKLYPYVKFYANWMLSLGLFLLIALVVVLFFALLCTLFSWPIYFLLPFSITTLFLVNWVVANPKNANCTSSGIVLLRRFASLKFSSVCFVLYDNHEYAHMGLRVFEKAYRPTCPVIRIGEVGRGEHFLCQISKSAAEQIAKQASFTLLTMHSKMPKIKIAVAYKNKMGYYMNRIKSPLDTEIDENILQTTQNLLQEMLTYGA